MLYDTDAGANYWGSTSPSTNYIEMVRNPLFTQSAHSDIFDRMLYNPTFKTFFINRYADLINTIFQQNSLNSVIESMKDSIATDMPRHIGRWSAPSSYNDWISQIQNMSNHMTARVQGARGNIQTSFNS